MSDKTNKKYKISDISFEHEGAHVALVLKSQGGPANNRHTLLLKSQSTADITEEDVKQLLEKASGETEVEKAKWNSDVRQALNELVREKYRSEDGWLYLEDFNATTLVVCRDDKLFTVSYSLSDNGEYVIGNDEQEVEVKRIFIEKGVASLSPEMEEALGEGVYSLLSKALDNPETNQRIVDAVGVTLEKAKVKMEEEIQKAVDAAKGEAAAELATVQAELEKAKEALTVVEAEKKATVMKARQEAVAKFDKDGAEALVKATEALADEAFETLLKSLSVGRAAVEESDLFKQASQQGSDKAPEENATERLIKSMAATKQ